MDGKRNFYYTDGSRYEGDWRFAKKNGKGVLYSSNWDRIMGDYINNKQIGRHSKLTVYSYLFFLIFFPNNNINIIKHNACRLLN